MIVEVTPDEGARFIVTALPPLCVALEALLPAVIPADVFQLDFAFLVSLRENEQEELCQRGEGLYVKGDIGLPLGRPCVAACWRVCVPLGERLVLVWLFADSKDATS